jgi:hypothetical protein
MRYVGKQVRESDRVVIWEFVPARQARRHRFTITAETP